MEFHDCLSGMGDVLDRLPCAILGVESFLIYQVQQPSSGHLRIYHFSHFPLLFSFHYLRQWCFLHPSFQLVLSVWLQQRHVEDIMDPHLRWQP